MRKAILIILTLIVCIVSVGGARRNPVNTRIDFEAQGFEKVRSTAYCVGHHTADGSAVFEGGCAYSPDHIGDVAIIYTLDGDFIGYLICNDTGGDQVKSGEILDVYKSDIDRCKEYMRLIGDSQMVWVRWIHGEG